MWRSSSEFAPFVAFRMKARFTSSPLKRPSSVTWTLRSGLPSGPQRRMTIEHQMQQTRVILEVLVNQRHAGSNT